MRLIFWVLLSVAFGAAANAAEPTCSAYQQKVAPNSPQCFETATDLQDTDIVYGVQGTGPSRANQSVKIPISQLKDVAAGAAPVQSVAGRDGDVTLSTTDISGLGTIATQSAASVAITGGTISGAAVSGSVATATGGTTARTLADRFAEVVNVKDFGAVGDGVTDDSAAISAAVARSNTLFAAGTRSCVYFPAGAYRIVSTLTQFAMNNPGCVFGVADHQTFIIVDASYSGDVFSWSDADQNSYSSPMTPAKDTAGPRIKDLTIIGDTSAVSQQNAFMFYDRTDQIHMDNVDVLFLNGYALGMGFTKNLGGAFVRESWFSNLNFWNCGILAPACLEITAVGTGDTSNQLVFFGLNVVNPTNAGVLVRNKNSGGKNVGGLFFFRPRVEAGTNDDLFRIGDTGSTYVGGIGEIHMFGALFNGSATGHAAIGTYSYTSSQAPTGIRVYGAIPTGSGNGLNLQSGNNMEFHLTAFTTTQTNVVVGAAPPTGTNIVLDGNGNETTWTTSIDATAVKNIKSPQMHTYGNTASGRSTAAFGEGNQVTGVYGFASGFSNVVSGTYSSAYGSSSTDRSRQSSLCGASGALVSATRGSSQACRESLIGTTSTASAVRLTSDNTGVQSANNCFNIPNNAAFGLSIKLIAVDNAAPANWYSWHLPHAAMARQSGAGTTTVSTGTPTILSGGTTTGVAVSATADTTQGCLNLSFTPPTGNSHKWDVQALIDSTEVQ